MLKINDNWQPKTFSRLLLVSAIHVSVITQDTNSNMSDYLFIQNLHICSSRGQLKTRHHTISEGATLFRLVRVPGLCATSQQWRQHCFRLYPSPASGPQG